MYKHIPAEHKEAMVAAYLAGATQKEAAALFGYSSATCFLTLQQYGIQARSKSESRRKVTSEEEAAMISAYLAGVTAEQAAASFGYSLYTCLRLLRKHKISPRTNSELKRKLTNEQEDDMIATYLAGATAKQAAEKFGCTIIVCLEALKRRGIKARSRIEYGLQASQEEEEAIIAAYLAGATLEEAATKFGYARSTCQQMLRRRGLPVRTKSETHRHYHVDESFFDQIDTEEKAYWLGFITADGCIRGNSINLTLKSTDVEHIHKFAASLQAEHPIIFVERKSGDKIIRGAGINIKSLRMAQAIKRLGVTERKSFTVQPCQEVPESLLKAYWRGVFDGDGSIYRRFNPSSLFWLVKLCGNQFIVAGFQAFLSQYVTSKARIQPDNKIFYITYGGVGLPRSIVKVLYEDATIYLDRKYALAQELMSS